MYGTFTGQTPAYSKLLREKFCDTVHLIGATTHLFAQGIVFTAKEAHIKTKEIPRMESEYDPLKDQHNRADAYPVVMQLQLPQSRDRYVVVYQGLIYGSCSLVVRELSRGSLVDLCGGPGSSRTQAATLYAAAWIP